VVCIDLDGDFDLDLAVANGNSNNVSILMNNGDGTFQSPVNYGAGQSPFSICSADFDGDLDFDLAVSNEDGDNVSILINNGNGTFQTAVNYAVGDGPGHICCGDLDGDLDIDIAVPNFGGNVSILMNNGNGTFQSAINYPAGATPRSVCCSDLDRDGDLDMAVANVGSDNVSILINLTNSAMPSSYSLVSPTDVDSVKSPVTFAWHKSIDLDPNDTVRYDLYLSRYIVFAPESTTVYDSLPDTTFTDSLDIKLWYWKVKAYDKWGAVRWSDQSWSFYVYLCGDCNGDGKITVSDVVCEINYLFKGGSAPVPLIAGDVNCDGKETVSDVVYKINYLFKGGPELCKDCP